MHDHGVLRDSGVVLGSPNKLVAIDFCDPGSTPKVHKMFSLIVDSGSGKEGNMKEGSYK